MAMEYLGAKVRAREFTINVPINIKINGDEVDVEADAPEEDDVGDFVPPLQQKIELLKKTAGVKSIYDDEENTEEGDQVFMKELASDDEPLE